MNSPQLKIALWHNLPSGGGSRALYDQVKGLVGRGHHIEVWCPPTADRTFLPLGEMVAEHVVPLDMTFPPGRGPIDRRLRPYRDMVNRLDAMDRHCRECASQINRGGFDVLFSHLCQFFRPTSIGRHVNLPGAVYLQEPYRWLYEAWPRLPWAAPPPSTGRSPLGRWKAMLRDLIHVQGLRVQVREELASAAGFDMILVNSLFSRESVMRAYNLESKVCYLGIDAGAFRPSDAPKENYVVGLGNIMDNKGLGLAVDSVAAIDEYHRPDLIWIGNFAVPDYLKEIEGRARGLGVNFIPKVNIPHADLVDCLGRASAMIYTSRLEPFGYAPLEANACGTAVVAVAEGGVRETIRDGVNGTLIADADPVALGRAILGYCSDPGRARSIGLAAREHVEKTWNLEAAIDRLEGRLLGLCRRSQWEDSPDHRLEGQPR